MKTSSAVVSLRVVRDRTVRYNVSTVSHSDHAAKLAQSLLQDSPHENLVAILLDTQSRVVGAHFVAVGGLAGCSASPRDLFRAAIAANAACVILAHNHPSGDPTPSAEDIAFTVAAVAAGKLLGCPIVDHVIIGGQGSFSMYARETVAF